MSSDSTLISSVDSTITNVIVHHPHLQKRRIHFSTTSDGVVTLEGQTHSYFEKQLAQEAVRNLTGVREVINLINVEW